MVEILSLFYPHVAGRLVDCTYYRWQWVHKISVILSS